jgi:hypothetical protein
MTELITSQGIDLESFPVETRQIYDTAGTYTWTKPDNCTYIEIECLGGGGGGGGTTALSGAIAGGGGGGCYSKRFKIAASTLPATLSVTVGARGVGNSGADGSAGGASYVGTAGDAYECRGHGGGGAPVATVANALSRGGLGGTAVQYSGFFSAGDLIVGGSYGGTSAPGEVAGAGGSSFYGNAEATNAVAGGSSGSDADLTTPYVRRAYGVGGGGSWSSGSAQTGGDGGDGLVIITEYYSN